MSKRSEEAALKAYPKKRKEIVEDLMIQTHLVGQYINKATNEQKPTYCGNYAK